MTGWIAPLRRVPQKPGVFTTYNATAFTIMEVLVAMGVLAVGILGVLSVFVFGISSTEHGKNLSKATTYGRDILEIIRSQGLAYKQGTIPPDSSSGLNDAADARRELDDGSPPGAFSGLPANTGYKRNISISRAANSGYLFDKNVLQCTVTIYWHEKGVERSMEMQAFLKPALGSGGGAGGGP